LVFRGYEEVKNKKIAKNIKNQIIKSCSHKSCLLDKNANTIKTNLKK